VSKIVYTPNGCPHGPPLPAEGKRYCASCQPTPARPPVSGDLVTLFRDLPDAYDAPQPCASPHAATVYVTDVPINETSHVKQARRLRENA